MASPNAPVLVTHSGTFHADDAFAYAILRAAFGLVTPGVDHHLVRTRDPAEIARADFVWDVGFVYDPDAMKFDHHQRDAPRRDDGTPYSSAGLVWNFAGRGAVNALMDVPAILLDRIAERIDREVIVRIDEIDNGHGRVDDGTGLASAVADFNPRWDSPTRGNSAAEDAAFIAASDACYAFLQRRVDAARALVAAEQVVLTAHEAGTYPEILEMPRHAPWQDTVFAAGLPVIYAVYPVPNGNWMIDAMPPEPGSFAQRLPLPQAWAGLQGADLAAASGVSDAVFAHRSRFIAAAGSKEGAMEMARRAVALGPDPVLAPG